MATDNFIQPSILRFDGHYDHWSMLMENFLRSKEYWHDVSDGVAEPKEEQALKALTENQSTQRGDRGRSKGRGRGKGNNDRGNHQHIKDEEATTQQLIDQSQQISSILNVTGVIGMAIISLNAELI
ncbi:hypothetical protein ACOSP7_028742 [Xanthoceras sorbifolium]